MKRRLLIFFALWAVLLLFMMLYRIVFVTVMPQYNSDDFAMLPVVMWHGVPNDLTMSTYLMWPVAIIMIVSLFALRGIRVALNVWAWVISALISIVFVADCALFPYWDIRLDTTVLFYIMTSPAAAMASVAWWQAVLGVILVILIAWGLHAIIGVIVRLMPGTSPRRKVWCTVIWVIIVATMLIPARGGVTVGTMTPARGYFSDDMRLNKSTTNPMFSLVYALCHPDKSIKTDYMSDAEAESTLAPLFAWCDSSLVTLDNKHPDIHLIILESFSAHLMPSLGGAPVAMRLDSIAATGVNFTDFYSESFRTDRALSVIHAGFPSIPTQSMLRDPSRFDRLPALARELRKAGYDTHYYYGGDLDFTNCGAYYRSTGFEHVVGDSDFPLAERMSKWGVPDGPLFDRALSEVSNRRSPSYTVIQTSSSHEPFDVPATLRADDKRLNAFAYTDSCVAAYLNGLKTTGRWDNALVIITADHFGVWPDTLTDPTARHHVPMVLTGGAIKQPVRVDRTGSQSSIAPTVLALLGLDHSMFAMSQNLLGACSDAGWAWFSQPDYFALRRDGTTSVVPVNAEHSAAARVPEAFIQTLFKNYKN